MGKGMAINEGEILRTFFTNYNRFILILLLSIVSFRISADSLPVIEFSFPGLVLSEDKSPIENASILIFIVDKQYGMQTFSRSDGSFALDITLEPPHYKIYDYGSGIIKIVNDDEEWPALTII